MEVRHHHGGWRRNESRAAAARAVGVAGAGGAGGEIRAVLAALAGALLLSGLLAGGCADRQTPSEAVIEAHPAGFNDPQGSDFHGPLVARLTPASCRTCHGADLRGEPGVPSCYACHNGPGGHPYGWVEPGGAHFHGDAVAATGPVPCRQCHGADYRGGWSGVSCYTCHAEGPSGHPDGWMDPRALSFHGRVAFTRGVDACRRCHGFPPDGGTAGLSCSECHGLEGPSAPGR